MNPNPCQEVLRKRLVQALSPTFLEIRDESHLHVGHPGAKSGGGHFKIIIASPQFLDKSHIACHRLVYAALEGLIGKEVHAVQICVQP
jgi:BolA protein